MIFKTILLSFLGKMTLNEANNDFNSSFFTSNVYNNQHFQDEDITRFNALNDQPKIRRLILQEDEILLAESDFIPLKTAKEETFLEFYIRTCFSAEEVGNELSASRCWWDAYFAHHAQLGEGHPDTIKIREILVERGEDFLATNTILTGWKQELASMTKWVLFVDFCRLIFHHYTSYIFKNYKDEFTTHESTGMLGEQDDTPE